MFLKLKGMSNYQSIFRDIYLFSAFILFRLLDELIKDEKFKDMGLQPCYYISGYAKDQEVEKIQFKTTKEEDVKSVKKEFSKILACKVNGVMLKDLERIKIEPQVEPSLTDEDLLKQQKLTYIINDQIKIRPEMAQKYESIHGKPSQKLDNVDVKDEKEKVQIQEKRRSPRPKASAKQSNKGKSRASKAKASSPKPEPEPDPFSEEEGEDDEEPVQESPIKKRKNRRVQVFDDDSDEEQRATLPTPKKKKKSPSPSPKGKKNMSTAPKMESVMVDEETVDDEGYTKVKKVRKCIPVDSAVDAFEEKPVSPHANNKNKRDSSDDKNPSSEEKKRNQKKQKLEEEEEEEEPKKGKAKPAAKGKSKLGPPTKGQASITSFFKPSQK